MDCTSPAAILLEDVEKSFGGLRAVASFSLAVEVGEVVGLVGPNGSGKSTVLRLASGSLPLDRGSIAVHGRFIRRISQARMARVGVVRQFQEPRAFATLNVGECVLVAKGMRTWLGDTEGQWPIPCEKEGCEAWSTPELLAQFLIDVPASTAVKELSQGQKRLLGLACAAASGARVLLLDEPTAGVSQGSLDNLALLLSSLARRFCYSMIVVEHNLEFLRRCADRVAVMSEGELVMVGSPTDVLKVSNLLRHYTR